MAGAADHLGSDELQLLLVQHDGDLLDLPAGPHDLLDNLDPAGWRSGRCVHLLGLQLDDLGLGGGGSGGGRRGLSSLLHCDGLHPATRPGLHHLLGGGQLLSSLQLQGLYYMQ